MMDPKLKNTWTKKLRSGEYEQGEGALRRGDEFCCLGVLCDILGADWEGRPKLSRSAIGMPPDEDVDVWEDPDDLVLHDEEFPPDLEDHLGLSGHMGKLIVMNDGDESNNKPQYDFHEIADYIEKNL